MTRRLLACPVLLLALSLAAYGDDKTGGLPPAPTKGAPHNNVTIFSTVSA